MILRMRFCWWRIPLYACAYWELALHLFRLG